VISKVGGNAIPEDNERGRKKGRSPHIAPTCRIRKRRRVRATGTKRDTFTNMAKEGKSAGSVVGRGRVGEAFFQIVRGGGGCVNVRGKEENTLLLRFSGKEERARAGNVCKEVRAKRDLRCLRYGKKERKGKALHLSLPGRGRTFDAAVPGEFLKLRGSKLAREKPGKGRKDLIPLSGVEGPTGGG